MESNESEDRIRKAQRRNVLDLSSKNLTSLPYDISQWENITELYISGNKLTSMPPEISEWKNLTELHIYGNKLTSLPPEVSEWKSLTVLDISNNQLTSLPSEIAEWKGLTRFDLSGNKLTSLPPEIIEWKNLTILYISDNELTSLPPEISEWKNLTELYISDNKLTSLPPEVSEWKNLTKLEISDNELISLPPEVSEWKNLTKLEISDNELTSLPPEISEWKNLAELDVSSNKLTSLPPEIAEWKNLTELYISGNKLTSLPPEISEWKNLTRLYISDNKLTSLLPEISEWKNLTELHIHHNQLTSLPPEISKWKNLTELHIHHNQLTTLPLEILKLDLEIEWKKKWKSNIIYLPDNPFENPPVEILKQGREAVLNYFKSLEGEKKPLNEVKVLLIGEGGAGKTSLVKRMFEKEFDGSESQTQGIEISKLTVINGEQEIIANFWDFGGQEIMHATHQFFLSKRSLYILVLDGRKDERPEYWLKLIENFGGDSPVLIIINKIDENPAFELNRKFLKEKYHSIRDFYRLSCKSSEGINEFSKALQEELTKVKHLEIEWPKSWFNVKSRLEKLCKNYHSIESNDDHEHFNFIEYREFRAVCEEEGITNESEQNTLVDFLHDLGVILHFRDMPLLNTHVLKPEWVTNAVYKIINSRMVADSRGSLKLDMLHEILRQNNESDFYYPPDQYDFIISLMKKFELSYDLDDRIVLLPSLLEIQEPNFEFDFQEALKFIIDYDFIPPSVMPRFIVKMNRDIKNGLQWRTGVVLENESFSSCAVIKSDNEAKRIYINVNGGQKRDYFSSILFNLREINKSFEKLNVVEKIPIPEEPNIVVSYNHLVNLQEMGINSFIPEGSKKTCYVSDLLGEVKIKRKEEELLEEIIRILSNKNEEEKLEEIVSILRDLAGDQAEESDNWETLSRKLNKTIMLQPSMMGVGFNFNEAIDLAIDRYFKWKRKNK